MKHYLLLITCLISISACFNSSKESPKIVEKNPLIIDALKQEIATFKDKEIVRDWMVLIDLAQSLRKYNAEEKIKAEETYARLKKADQDITLWSSNYHVAVLTSNTPPSKAYLDDMLKQLKEIDKTIDAAVSEGKQFLTKNNMEVPDTFKAPKIDKNKKPDFTVIRNSENSN